MYRTLMASIALVVPGTAVAQTAEVAEGNWQGIPPMAVSGTGQIGLTSAARIDKVIFAGKCPKYGRRNYVNLSVPFLAQFDGSGKPTRVVVKRVNCPELEEVLASAALDLVKSGRYAPTGVNPDGWYASEITYYFQ
jgi:hypothetical protein